MKIVLCGMPGAGKSTVGKLLAARLHLAFADTDEAIEAEYGPISRIFEERGERAFRAIEQTVFQTLLAQEDIVIATGGGIVTTEGCRALIKGTRAFWLDAGIGTLLARLAGDESRYLLRGDLKSRLETLWEARSPLYRSVAVRVETEGLAPEAVAEAIAREVTR